MQRFFVFIVSDRGMSTKPIYGGASTYVSTTTSTTSTYVVDTCCKDALLALTFLFSAIENVVDIFFPSLSIIAPMIAPMGARAGVSEKVYVRLIWRHEYEGIIFHPENLLQRLQIKEIYLRYGWDYTVDPLFMDPIGLTLV